MCSRYILASKPQAFEKRFCITIKGTYLPSYNIGEGKRAWVVSNANPSVLTQYVFGLTPDDSPYQTLITNVRSEGTKNPDDDPCYTGGMGIIYNPTFNRFLRSQRCLVIADGFYTGSAIEGFEKPYLVFLKHKVRPFAFAGIWNRWKNPGTGENVFGFAILTTVATGFLREIGCRRCPVILEKRDEQAWLNPGSKLNEITRLLKPYDPSAMDAYEVSSALKDSRNDSVKLLQKTGRQISDKEKKLRVEIQELEMKMRNEKVNTRRPETQEDYLLIKKHQELLNKLFDLESPKY